jgi:hypothetical protein
MNTPTEILDTLKSCDTLEDLLAKDNKHTREVGFILESDSTTRQLKTGEHNEIGFYGVESDENPVCIVHTHPTIDNGPTLSEKDLSVNKWGETVCGIIALSQDMLETRWEGICAYFNPDGSVDKEEFVIVCDGTTDGPAADRWIANPEIKQNR